MTGQQQGSSTSYWVTKVMLFHFTRFFVVGSHLGGRSVAAHIALPAYTRSEQREEARLCTAKPWQELRQCHLHWWMLHSGRIPSPFLLLEDRRATQKQAKIQASTKRSRMGRNQYSMCNSCQHLWRKIECSPVCSKFGQNSTPICWRGVPRRSSFHAGQWSET